MNEFERAQRVIPGGVNSPVRAFGAVGGTPLFISSGQGAYLQDTHGKRYVDYVLSWGALIAGHAHPQILEAVHTAAARGLSFGAPTESETILAETLCECLPSLEQVRLVSSGTEAAMSAVRLARGYTGRPLLLKFEGHYHGHGDSLLVKAGSGALTFGQPSSKGVPEAIAGLTLIAPFNDLAALENIFSTHGAQLAGVIIEPVPGNMNLIRPQQKFLLRLRQLCTQHQTVLIFDEVMCGFRVGLQGAQGLFNIRPDLTVLGKVIGGGLPLAAFGGRKDILQQLAPTGPVYQAGTLSGNPVAVAAGLAALSLVRVPGYYEKLKSHSESLCQRLQQAAAAVGFGEFSTQSIGSMFGFYFRKQPPENYDEAIDCNIELFKKFFHSMLQHGIYLAPSAFEAGFLSSAHGEEELHRTEVAARASFAQLARVS